MCEMHVGSLNNCLASEIVYENVHFSFLNNKVICIYHWYSVPKIGTFILPVIGFPYM